jgi:hypothetical protein
VYRVDDEAAVYSAPAWCIDPSAAAKLKIINNEFERIQPLGNGGKNFFLFFY